MSRVQLALNVDDLDTAVAFYSTLFGAEPAKRKPGYANFAIAEPPLKLVLIENAGAGGSINHLGVEVESTDRVQDEIARLTGAGLIADEEMGTTCCYATQDKAWLTGPGGERWEVYTVLADSPTFGTSPRTLLDAGQAPEGTAPDGTAADGTAPDGAVEEGAVCCGGRQTQAGASAATDPEPAATASTCC